MSNGESASGGVRCRPFDEFREVQQERGFHLVFERRWRFLRPGRSAVRVEDGEKADQNAALRTRVAGNLVPQRAMSLVSGVRKHRSLHSTSSSA